MRYRLLITALLVPNLPLTADKTLYLYYGYASLIF